MYPLFSSAVALLSLETSFFGCSQRVPTRITGIIHATAGATKSEKWDLARLCVQTHLGGASLIPVRARDRVCFISFYAVESRCPASRANRPCRRSRAPFGQRSA